MAKGKTQIMDITFQSALKSSHHLPIIIIIIILGPILRTARTSPHELHA